MKVPNYQSLPNTNHIENGLVISVGGHTLLFSVVDLDRQESVPQ